MSASKAQANAIVQTVFALTEAIRGLGEVPAGHLYAQVMSKMSHETFERVLAIIVESGVVERRGDLLVWKGSPPEPRVRVLAGYYQGTYVRNRDRFHFPVWINEARPQSMPLPHSAVTRWLAEGKAEEVKP